MLISIGDRVQPGTYELHSRFARAANYSCGQRMVSLVTQAIGPGPTRLVVSSPRVARPTALKITRHSVTLGARRISRARIPRYESRLSRAAVAPENLAALERTLTRYAPAQSLAYLLDDRRMPRAKGFARALAEHMRSATADFLDALRSTGSRRLAAAVREIAGCGHGLTPAGDDFIAGALIASRLLNPQKRVAAEIARAARTGNALSAHFIELAADGRAPEDVKDLARTLAAGTPAQVGRAARRVFRHGATSGADLCTGLAMTLKYVGRPLAADEESLASELPTRSDP